MNSPDSKTSKFQKMFSTQQTFKRNKHYVDVLKINEQEHVNQQKRRRPDNRYKRNSHKVDQSFKNNNKEMREHQLHDIQKFKFRLSYYSKSGMNNPEVQSTGFGDTRYERSKSPREIKGVPLDKNLSRQTLNRRKQKPCPDERQFTNFYITKHDLSHIPHLGKYSPRNLNIAHQHMNDLYYDCNKKFQDCNFNNTTNSCLFNLKKQDDEKERYFFIPQRQENKPSTDIDPAKISKSFSVANHYKPNKILNFYKINGRDNPSQFDHRYLSPNKNFYYGNDGKLIKKQIGFTVSKYKDILLNREKEQFQNSKNPIFTREEICDYKYFKQERRRQSQLHQH